jgi:pilus assembly protein CpaC
MAGLLNNLSQDDVQEVPGLAHLPIIGHLFRSKTERAEQTELLVLITPQLVRPLNPDEVPPLPTLERRFLPRGGDLGDQIQGGGGIADGPDVQSPR